MTKIMGKACNQERKLVDFVELSNFCHSLILEQKTDVLGCVRAMEVVMILNLVVISALNLLCEAHILLKINGTSKPVDLQDSHPNAWQNLVTADLFNKVENIEVKGIHRVQKLSVHQGLKLACVNLEVCLN